MFAITLYPAAEVEQIDGVTIVRLAARAVRGPRALGEMARLLRDLADEDGCCRMVVNFAQIRAVPSAVLAELILLHKQLLASGGRLALCGIEPAVYPLFGATGLDRVFAIYPTEEEALQDCSAHGYVGLISAVA